MSLSEGCSTSSKTDKNFYLGSKGLIEEIFVKDLTQTFRRRFYKKGAQAVEMLAIGADKTESDTKVFVRRGDESLVVRHFLQNCPDFSAVDLSYGKGGTKLSKAFLYFHGSSTEKSRFLALKFKDGVINLSSTEFSGDMYLSRYSEDRGLVYQTNTVSLFSVGIDFSDGHFEGLEMADPTGLTGVIFPGDVASGVEGLSVVDIIVDQYNDSWVNILKTACARFGSYRVLQGLDVKMDMDLAENMLVRVGT